MALTINTHPDEVITNAPEFDVTTDVVEGASFQDVRIRATIYAGGHSDPVAVLEQAKGLDDWNFFKNLKSLTGKADYAMGAGFRYKTAAGSAELLTAWTEANGDFTTFTTSGRTITSAITTGTYDYAKSNDLGSVVVGDVLMIGFQDVYSDSGANPIQAVYSAGSTPLGLNTSRNRYAGLSSGKLTGQHMYFFLAIGDNLNPYMYLGNDNAGTNLACTDITIRKISGEDSFKGNPGIYFKVKFEEVYENASDVTTIGDTEYSDTMLFIPMSVRPGESFSDFLITDATTEDIATRNVNGDVKYPFGAGLELRFFFITTCPWVRIEVVTDAGTSYVTGVCYGWGIIIISETTCTIVSADADIVIAVKTSNYALTLNSGTSTDLSILNDTKCYSDLKALSFVGALGEETVLFRGLPSEAGGAEKSFIKDQNRVRKVLKAYKRSGEILRTLYETEEMRRLLHELVYTGLPVWMYNEDFTDSYREVTVITDETAIEDQKSLIESEIEVEYYE